MDCKCGWYHRETPIALHIGLKCHSLHFDIYTQENDKRDEDNDLYRFMICQLCNRKYKQYDFCYNGPMTEKRYQKWLSTGQCTGSWFNKRKKEGFK